MLSLGSGSRHAIAIGMPHPNEPTGALAQLRMIQLLLADPDVVERLGLVWHLIPCADPDGAMLNQGWLRGPFDRRTYSTHLYRSPYEEQFEWTFHRSELEEPGLPATPESLAVMKVIDSLRPDLLVSMHNGEVGGMFSYVTGPTPDLTSVMTGLRDTTGIPFELGDLEGPVEHLSPGVYLSPPNLGGGAMLCSTDYASQYGTFGITTEPPLWSVAAAEDTRPLPKGPHQDLDLIHDEHSAFASLIQHWLDAIEAHVPLNARLRALKAMRQTAQHDWLRDLPTPTTVAQLSARRRLLDLDRLRGAGQVVGVLADHAQVDALDEPLQAVLDDARAHLSKWLSSDGTVTTRFVGLDGAVDFHVGLTLGAASQLAKM